ncbi:MAG: alcohol dehydrogenase catalytic domain-containing protein, partial [Lawsonibacter sp.]|nr:alcohol dehydrogenase catalytic domain-containing protein [Lawsonibacter sp.]
MKAVQITDVKNIEIIDTCEPKLKENHAEISVKAMGICGSDVHAYAGKSPNVTYPVIIGHETAGIVTKIAEGSNLHNIKIGDRVVLNPYIYCGHCYPCSL